MALFKVLKGGSARLANQTKTEGYAYYTVDDGGFYIDAAAVNSAGTGSTGSVLRKRINDAANTSFSGTDISATNVQDALIEISKSLSYSSAAEKLTLS